MPIFPEHLHLAGEDAQLHDVERHNRLRTVVEFYSAAIVFAAVLIAAAIIVLLTF